MWTLIIAIIISLLVGACFGYFLRGLADMAGCVLLALLAFSPAPAEALTKQECIHLGYGCQWSRATGGKASGWFYTTGKKQAAGKPSKANAKADPSKSSTPMSAVADAVASAFDGTDRQSSTRGSKRENAHEHPADIRVVRSMDRHVLGSEGAQALRAADPVLRDRDPVQVTPPRLTLQQAYEEGARLLSIRLGAEVILKYGAKLAEAGR